MGIEEGDGSQGDLRFVGIQDEERRGVVGVEGGIGGRCRMQVRRKGADQQIVACRQVVKGEGAVRVRGGSCTDPAEGMRTGMVGGKIGVVIVTFRPGENVIDAPGARLDPAAKGKPGNRLVGKARLGFEGDG